MDLHCNQCRHHWEDDVEEERKSVFCPRCATEVPLATALMPEASRTQTARPTSPPRSVSPPRAAATPPPMAPTASEFGADSDASDAPTHLEPGPPSSSPSGPGPTRTAGRPMSAGPARSAPPKSKSGAPRSGTGTQGATPKDMNHLIGQTIDGYRIEGMLGTGGMGSVFLAHQISLDRKVALKVLPNKFASNADLLARFTREALSAAQLNHHNIIQVYDVGSAGDLHYISMEFVRGKTLADMTKEEGRLQPDDAAGYVLQTARGLKYAHDRGIIHRDIKPANLMVNEHGVVKIADMGLAKMRGVAEKLPSQSGVAESPSHSQLSADLTHADVAMGTPAYMAPEQTRDASSVDGRADEYSLGCTLYYLCTGKAPFGGSTVYEIFSKHQTEPPPSMDVHVHGIPGGFKRIVERMLEKVPESRYQDMSEVVKDLESYLGIDSEKGPYTPRETHVMALEAAQKAYYAAASLPKRRIARLAFLAAMPVLFFGALFTKHFALAGGLLGLLALTPLANFIADGILTKAYLFRRVRAVFFGMPVMSWVMTVGGAALTLGALWMVGWLGYWIVFAVLAAGLASGYQWLVERPLRIERTDPISQIQNVLRELRIKGVSEDALQDFVARFSGTHWEEFFEELFGYEAMVLARAKWAAADKVNPRKKFATWRDSVARWLLEIEEGRKNARDKKQLAKVETQRLKATGVSEADAKKQASEAATRIMEKEVKRRPMGKPGAPPPGDAIIIRRSGSRNDTIFALVRGAFGVAMLLAYASVWAGSSLPIPGFVTGILESYGRWGFGMSYGGGIAGLALLASAFSVRALSSALIFAGALVIAFGSLLVDAAQQPQLTATSAFSGGLLMIALGIAPAIMGKLTGAKF